VRRVFAALVVGAVITTLGAANVAAETVSPAERAAPNIIGGHPPTEQYPWIATISIKHIGDQTDFLDCTGQLIANNVVMTAAHCMVGLDGKPFDPSLWQIRVGSADPKSGGTLANVTRVVGFPSYNGYQSTDAAGRWGDVSLWWLDRYLPNQPIELAASQPRPRTAVREIGYGMTNPAGTGPSSPLLQELDTTVAADRLCGPPADGPIGTGELCVNNVHGTDGPCYGDSGGPVAEKLSATRWAAVAITIRGAAAPGTLGCGSEKAIDTSVAYYRPWIFAVERGEDPVVAEKYLPRSH
jgi:secreted trypsin-like serine protease